MLATHALALAQSGGSLNDARNAINKGTSPGIVIIGAKRRAPEASAAAASASAPTQTPAAAATPLAERVGAALKLGDPPSGLPLSAARRLDSPSLGIAIPSARPAASQPAAK